MSRCIAFDWPARPADFHHWDSSDDAIKWQAEADFCKGERFRELLSFLFERSDLFSLRFVLQSGGPFSSDAEKQKQLQRQLEPLKIKKIKCVPSPHMSFHVAFNNGEKGSDSYYHACDAAKEALLQCVSSLREMINTFPHIRFYKEKQCQFDALDDWEGMWTARVVNVTKPDIAYMIDRGFATTACIHATPEYLEGDILPFEV